MNNKYLNNYSKKINIDIIIMINFNKNKKNHKLIGDNLYV